MQNDVLCTSKWKQVAGRGKELLIQKAEQEGGQGCWKGGFMDLQWRTA